VPVGTGSLEWVVNALDAHCALYSASVAGSSTS
jgi:hypothetical protein